MASTIQASLSAGINDSAKAFAFEYTAVDGHHSSVRDFQPETFINDVVVGQTSDGYRRYVLDQITDFREVSA
jgi:hypothetical protein